MALPDTTRRAAEKALDAFCAKRIPADLPDQVRLGYRFRGDSATLLEEREALGAPGVWVDIVVAQFRFSSRTKQWTLYCADRNSRWNEYIDTEPTHDLEALLKEVDRDPTGIFWG